MLGLVRLGLSIALAHRLVLSGYALALPLAGLFCLRAAAPASAPLALLLLPLVWSWFAVQGLYNYVLSLPPALVWLGIVARDGARPRPVAALALVAAALVVFSRAHGDLCGPALRHRAPHRLSGGRSRVDSRAPPVADRLGAAGPVALALLPALPLWAASCRGDLPSQASRRSRPFRAGRCTTSLRRSARSSSSSPCATTSSTSPCWGRRWWRSSPCRSPRAARPVARRRPAGRCTPR